MLNVQRRWAIGSTPEYGDIIGYTTKGTPVRYLGGGARETYENWLPVEHGGAPIVAFQQKSAVEAGSLRHEPMAAETKDVDRSGGFEVGAVGKGAAYDMNAAVNDKVRLVAEKIGGAVAIAEEDIADTTTNILNVKKVEAAGSMAKFYDQAALATTAVGNGITVLYNSVYYQLRNNLASTGDPYTGDANRLFSLTPDWTKFSDVISKVEDGEWVSGDENLAWWMHPSFKGILRTLKDGQNAPIWIEGVAKGNPDTLLGYPIYWTRGAKTDSVSTSRPSGNALAIFGDRKGLIVGDRTGMETAVSDQVAWLQDEIAMKARMRKGFNISHPKAFAMLELASS